LVVHSEVCGLKPKADPGLAIANEGVGAMVS
jgi:hypothetical protein